MTKQNIKSFKNISRLKKIIVVTGTFVSIFGGMYMGIVAIANFKNYDSPYLFGFIMGTIGLLTGFFVSRKIKSAILINQKMQQNYSLFTFYIITSFIGLFLLIGQNANIVLSKKENCDNFFVVDKILRKRSFRRAESRILVININGVYRRYITNSNYWQTIQTGQEINVCIYKSLIGFDYLKLTNGN